MVVLIFLLLLLALWFFTGNGRRYFQSSISFLSFLGEGKKGVRYFFQPFLNKCSRKPHFWNWKLKPQSKTTIWVGKRGKGAYLLPTAKKIKAFAFMKCLLESEIFYFMARSWFSPRNYLFRRFLQMCISRSQFPSSHAAQRVPKGN